MTSNKRAVLVTGSNGFVGKHLVKYLASRGYTVVASSRTALASNDPKVTYAQVPDLITAFDWRPLLSQCDTVIHLAGIAHKSADEHTYDLVNVKATASIVKAARESDISQFVFISSIAAQSGPCSEVPLSEEALPKPTNAYGRSKLASEEALRAAGVPYTILRPVVMYGPGEKGNFELIHDIARLPIPLPFGALNAPRSVLSIDNFNSAVEFVLMDARALGETIIVSDPASVGVAEMIVAYRVALGRRPNLFHVPEKWIKATLGLVGLTTTWQRLGMPLLAPPAKLLRMGWRPVHTYFSPADEETSVGLPVHMHRGSAPRSSVGRSRDGNLM